jgi:hypothetical protein
MLTPKIREEKEEKSLMAELGVGRNWSLQRKVY